MAIWEGKKYKLEKSENFDEYMKELGEFFLLYISGVVYTVKTGH